MKYNVFDAVGSYLGVVHAADAEEALSKAREEMPTAMKVEPRDVEAQG